ncbi:MAG TPA: AMP-binding protein, partial [Jatrophihabitans sp.]|nr:AMP-binding protein [Jatrophihabitans sp.]
MPDRRRSAMTDTIGTAFARVVAGTPRAIALRTSAGNLSYAELDARANRLAHHLLRRGIRPEEPVAVVDDHSAELVISLLAIVKAGGCYLGIDGKQPAERTAATLASAGVRWVLAADRRPPGADRQAPAADRQAPAAPEVPPVEWLAMSELDLAGEPSTDPGVAAQPAQLAYLAYTSGSTGVPKAAMI